MGVLPVGLGGREVFVVFIILGDVYFSGKVSTLVGWIDPYQTNYIVEAWTVTKGFRRFWTSLLFAAAAAEAAATTTTTTTTTLMHSHPRDCQTTFEKIIAGNMCHSSMGEMDMELLKSWYHLFIIQAQCTIESATCGKLQMCILFQLIFVAMTTIHFRCLGWKHMLHQVRPWFFQRVQLRQQQLMNRIRHTEGVGDGSCHSQTWEDNKRK